MKSRSTGGETLWTNQLPIATSEIDKNGRARHGNPQPRAFTTIRLLYL